MKLIAMIGGALLLVAAGVGGGYFFMKQDSGMAAAEQRKPLFFPMERFVISVDSGVHSRYLVLELTLLTHDAQVIATLQEASPLLRNALVEQFSTINHSEVKDAFKDIPQVQQQLLDKLNSTLRLHKFSQQIEQVLVTNVFIQ